MKIGPFTLKVGAPDEARLLASTGCTPDRMAGFLRSRMLAGHVAAALLACALGERLPERQLLAEAIARAGVDAVRRRVELLYRPKKGAKRGK
jgi:hypothetical protein